MMKRVRKAIIPAAGLGTRFLPATKAMPKEMLPIVDKPTIQYIVEEAIKSGIEDIIIVTGKTKRSIEDHFDNAFELEQNLLEKKKYELLEKVQASSKMVDIHYIRQKEPKGLGHAVWCARKFIGDEPFAVLLGDDIVQAEKPCLRQLIEEYDKTLSSVIGVQTVPEDETHRYGIIDPLEQEGRRYQVRNFVEKPAAGTAPSNLAIMGRYVLTPEIFMFLEQQHVGAGGEIQLTDAIQNLNEIQRVFAYDFEGKRYDVGEKLGFVQTTIEMALQHPELRDEMVPMMQKILEEHTKQQS
ncbi:UTP-glucose-1-phosphate uridylyltransferase [Bacillus cereus]|uniref:UTP--glucose-1-phosphate uridylyltransferase n=9 Tax=Bacillus TaxID=1386 RepID=A0AB37Z151_9BACI|nr:UTP--glucose-1-phosphate uridylyltransferase [Bacillus wiedmannii]SCC65227.1 UTP-glucose-1-phosphate uridylyltransferase [Bacillus wiedmannii]SCC66610.1 UTP-glucose-1-phosphate uridylyltransferase [Bacillus cereus]SCN38798.1 UTP-glucose-1-phosphate uridylyltransferase [Bacillus cereus]SCN40354.1 UTP-glucose-1-phosphate uridylyltransferase [Bacillus wiedmannii]